MKFHGFNISHLRKIAATRNTPTFQRFFEEMKELIWLFRSFLGLTPFMDQGNFESSKRKTLGAIEMKTPQKLFDAVCSQELTIEQVKELEQASNEKHRQATKEFAKLAQQANKAKKKSLGARRELSDIRLAIKFIELGKIPQPKDKMFINDPDDPEWTNKPCEIIQYEPDWHKADVYVPNEVSKPPVRR